MTDNKKIAGVELSVIEEVKEVQRTYALTAVVEMENFEKSLMIGQGIARLTKLIHANEPIVTALMYLQGKKLGFKTDKEYESKVVVDCFVEASIRGLPMSGNTWNIIAGNLYVTGEGFDHLLDELKGFIDYFIEWGDYEKDNKTSTAKVNFKATWKYKGVDNEMSGFVPVRVNSGMVVDAIFGKANRKVGARIYKKITKSAAFFDEKDISEIDTTLVHQGTAPQLNEGSSKISGGNK